MQKVTLIIPLKTISLNHSHTLRRNKRTGKFFRGKSESTDIFEKNFTAYLFSYRKELLDFVSKFDRFNHIVELSATYFIKDDLFFTKPKSKSNPRIEINRNSGDIDNCLKLPIDLIFRFMGVDDKSVKRLAEIEQVPSNENGVMFTLTLKPFPGYKEFPKLKEENDLLHSLRN